MRTFVVGDVHGHAQKLRKLLRALREQAESEDTLVFVGDYIDRGPDSRGVLEMVIEQSLGGWDGPVVPLKGNHEALMLDFISKRPTFPPEVWIQNGGFETISSYTGGEFTKRWLSSVPPAHLEFMQNLRTWYEDEHAYYVHAGLRPEQRPEDADEEVLLWIREEFIDAEYDWGKVVVFGHTPQYEQPTKLILDRSELPWRPLDLPEKIGIDTGAAYGGPLSAVILPEREFVSVK